MKQVEQKTLFFYKKYNFKCLSHLSDYFLNKVKKIKKISCKVIIYRELQQNESYINCILI